MYVPYERSQRQHGKDSILFVINPENEIESPFTGHLLDILLASVFNIIFKKVYTMLQWVLTFLVIAIVAGILGFTGIAAAATEVAKIVFVIFLVLFVISLVTHLLKGK
jgi:uncharacterized membrane protein YtjA (UPF0391 family)